MIKKTILASLISVFALQLSAQELIPLRLTGKIKQHEGTQIYLEKYVNKVFHKIDSSEIKNGKFQFNTKLELPELYGIRLAEQPYPFQVFLEEGDIQIEISNTEGKQVVQVVGSKAQDRFDSFKKRSRDLTAEAFIKEDPASIVSAYALFRNYSYDLSPSAIETHISWLAPTLSNSQYVKILKDLVAKQKAVLPGNKALDFTSTDPEGNSVKFSEHLGKGYVLLDFWASWCVPCRKENPNIVKAFEKYQDKGFTVFGVSLDKKKEDWIAGIKEDGLNWPQVSDLAFWDTEAAALYGVRFIPSNLLIDPNGIIIARNIKAEELQNKLKEIYGY